MYNQKNPLSGLQGQSYFSDPKSYPWAKSKIKTLPHATADLGCRGNAEVVEQRYYFTFRHIYIFCLQKILPPLFGDKFDIIEFFSYVFSAAGENFWSFPAYFMISFAISFKFWIIFQFCVYTFLEVDIWKFSLIYINVYEYTYWETRRYDWKTVKYIYI